VRIIKKRTSREEMLRNFAESRIYIGVSLSDGISTSLLEAMATGCYPIQTGTACADEWLTENSGTIVAPGSVQEIADAIREAIESDVRVDAAATTNLETIRNRASSAVVSSIARNFYEEAFENAT
jgi:glycosyltransferase involved in cell wall biosynthesis